MAIPHALVVPHYGFAGVRSLTNRSVFQKSEEVVAVIFRMIFCVLDESAQKQNIVHAKTRALDKHQKGK
jgi:hypothetical protein